MSNHDQPANFRRRQFFSTLGIAAGGVALSELFAPRAEAIDLPHLQEDDSTAVMMNYKEDTSKVDQTKFPEHTPTQMCSNCKYWQAEPNDEFSACQIFSSRAVANKGWCQVYEAKE